MKNMSRSGDFMSIIVKEKNAPHAMHVSNY